MPFEDLNMPDDAELLRRAVKSARDYTAPTRAFHARWVAVMRTFALGSTCAQALCRRCGFNPDQEVRMADNQTRK